MATGKYCYDYPRPMVTVDAVVFAEVDGRLHVLLVERGNEPFKGHWALPGGFVDIHERLETAAVRELEEETGVTGVPLEQLRAFGEPGRDPRGRSIGIAFHGVTQAARHAPAGADDATDARWVPVAEARPLAFDHGEILAYAMEMVARLAADPGETLPGDVPPACQEGLRKTILKERKP